MNKQDSMKPIDIVVILALTLRRSDAVPTFAELGANIGISASTAFESIARLKRSGLVLPSGQTSSTRDLHNFLVHGARHAFPPIFGREAMGVPTAHSGPALADIFEGERAIVWPANGGAVRGISLTPLYPKAVELPKRSPELYFTLTLVDAIRTGQPRERTAAVAAIDHLLETS